MKEPNDPRMSGRIAMYALLFAAAFIGVMVWIGA